jgi:hypothetical protein
MQNKPHEIVRFSRPKQKRIGEARLYSHNRQIPIMLDDEAMKEAKFRYIGVVSDGSFIAITSAFLSLPVPLQDAAIWHEVGHVVLGHITKAPEPPFTDRHQMRRASAMKGELFIDEAEADDYAARRVGVVAMQNFLGHLKNTRLEIGNAPTNLIGAREIELRIARLSAKK